MFARNRFGMPRPYSFDGSQQPSRERERPVYVCAESFSVDTRGRVRQKRLCGPTPWDVMQSSRIPLKSLQFVRRPARFGLIAAAFALTASPQRSPRSPFDNPEIHVSTARDSHLAARRQGDEDTRRFEARVQDLVRAWNSFALEYVDRGTFNVRKARDVNKAWRSLQGETTWPKK